MAEELELEQAQGALQSENWLLLNQALPHLLLPETALATCSRLRLEAGDYWQQVCYLALAVLEFGDFAARWEVAKFFPSLGTVAIAPLLQLLQDEEAEWELRWFAARTLGEMQEPGLIQALVELLKTPNQSQELQEAIAEALTNLGTPAIQALIELLGDPRLRRLAVQSLAQIRHPDASTALLSVAHDPQEQIRLTALVALVSCPAPDVVPLLIAALEDPSPQVRREAVLGLGLRPDIPGMDVVLLLQQRLQDGDGTVAQQAAIALGRLGTDAAAQALLAMLQASLAPESLQVEAVRTLGWMGTATALSCLEQTIALPVIQQPALRQELITALGRIEQPGLKLQAVTLLLALLAATNQPTERQAIALALGELGESTAIPALVQLVTDQDEMVGLHGIAALKKLDPQAVQPQLAELLERGSEMKLSLGVAVALREWHIGEKLD